MNLKKRIAAVLSGCTVLMGMPWISAAAAEETPTANAPPYYYEIRLATDKTGSQDGTVQLDLYVKPNFEANQIPTVLDAGTFGLRFPKWIKQLPDFTFTDDSEEVELQPTIGGQNTDTITASQYLVFTWSRVGGQADWKIREYPKGNFIGLSLYLGNVTFTLPNAAGGGYQYPSKTSIGMFNWLKADEAAAPNFGSQAQADQYNETIWKNGCYQGYAGTDEDGLIQQRDIGFQFTPPAAWPNAFSVLSYDPKKQLTVSLFKYPDGLKVENALKTIEVPIWNAKDTGEVFGIGPNNAGTGVGIYANAVNLDEIKVEANASYLLVIEKPGHLNRSYVLTTGSDASLTSAAGMPGEDEEIYLPCGDINPKQADKFGDGRIDLADRAALMAHLGLANWAAGGGAQVSQADSHKLADLDGDGKVTAADLSILMSPINFLQIETGVG